MKIKQGLYRVASMRLLTLLLKFIFKFINKYRENNYSEAEIKKDIEIASNVRNYLAHQLNPGAKSETEWEKPH